MSFQLSKVGIIAHPIQGVLPALRVESFLFLTICHGHLILFKLLELCKCDDNLTLTKLLHFKTHHQTLASDVPCDFVFVRRGRLDLKVEQTVGPND